MLNNVNLQNPNKTDLILEALNTMSGDIVTFEGVGGMPLKKLKVNIEPVQAGSGDPSPDNVRPITGWTGVKLYKYAKNLYDKEKDTANRYLDASGNWKSIAYSFITGLIPCKPNVRYYHARVMSSSYERYMAFYKSDGSTLIETKKVLYAGSFVTPQNAYYMRFSLANEYAEAFCVSPSPITEEVGDFNGIIYDIAFPSEAGTVYGGTIDVIKGVLTVTHGNIAEYAGEELPGEWISSMDVYEEGATPTTGAQVVYELEEPMIYQLTPEEVTALLGENNIWADTGDVEVQYGQYLSTLKEYIDAKVADLQAQIDSNEEVAP